MRVTADRHHFDVRGIPVKDSDDAERKARDYCDRYFNDVPYTFDVETEALRTLAGVVVAYTATVTAAKNLHP